MSKAKVKELHYRRSRRALGVELVRVNLPIFILFTIIIILGFIFLYRIFSAAVIIGGGIALLLSLILIVASVTISIRLWWKSKEYIISPDRIVIVDGIWGSRQRVFNMKGQVGMQLHQPPIKKWFNYGTISIKFMGGDSVNITNVSFPEKKILQIEELIDKGEVEI